MISCHKTRPQRNGALNSEVAANKLYYFLSTGYGGGGGGYGGYGGGGGGEQT